MGLRELKAELNAPVPAPSEVLVVRDTVGLELVDQTTPRAVTDAPPSALTLPPDDAVVAPMALTALVVRVGMVTGLVPYRSPT